MLNIHRDHHEDVGSDIRPHFFRETKQLGVDVLYAEHFPIVGDADVNASAVAIGEGCYRFYSTVVDHRLEFDAASFFHIKLHGNAPPRLSRYVF